MAQRPNRLPSNLRDRTLINETRNNKLSSSSPNKNTPPSVQISGNSGTSNPPGGGGVSFVNSGSSSEGEKSKSEHDKIGSKTANHSSPNGINVASASPANSSARKTPSPSPSPSPSLGVRSPNSTSRTSSPKLVVKEVLTEEKEQKTDIQTWMQDGLSELSNSSQNRLSPPGSGFSRISSSPAQLTALSDSKESLPNSSKSGGSMDGKEEKEHR